jgi:VWFA-related protein
MAGTPAADPSQQVTQTPTTPPQPTQAPGLTFRATTNYVEVDAIVTDASGRFVRGLEPGDFDVLEDGKPQKLMICSLVDIPVERPDPPIFRDNKPIEPDVVTNEKPFEGRVFMIVLDGFHIATLRSNEVRKQASLFIERYLGANDLAAVIHVGNPSAGQEFTPNKRLLLASIARFTGQALNSATANLVRDANNKNNQQDPAMGIDPGPPEDTERRERAYMARESVDSLRTLSEYMAGLSGRRKAVLFFSEGIDYETSEAPTSEMAGRFLLVSDAGAVRASQSDMIAAATRANVSVYSIDPRGLTSGMEDAIMVGSTPSAPMDSAAVPGRDYSQPNFAISMANEVKIAQESLRLFSDQTGGRAIINQNDMDTAFGRILEDNSSYYILGYVSPDSRRDGRFHRVAIRLKRPGLQVRARNGYFAASDKQKVKVGPPDPLRDMLGNPAPVSGLGMHMSASVMRTAEGQGRVHMTVEFSGKDVPFKPLNNLFVNDIEIGFHAQSMTTKANASGRHIMHLRLLPATHEAFPRTGVRYVTEFNVEPGRYQLRVAAREQQTGRAGSVFHDLEVPDFKKETLAMSDLLLTTSVADKTLTGKASQTLGAKLPGQTTTARTFAPTDTLSVFAAVYDSETRPHTVDLKVSVTADDGAQVFGREDARSSQELAGAAGEFPYTISVPLRALKPGRYVLAVEARSRLGTAITKMTEFSVR